MSVSNTATTLPTPKAQPSPLIPDPSPNVRASDPDFGKLTAAEKLNDRSYRQLVYQTYPNEPTCACQPEVSHSSANRADRGSKSAAPKSPGNFLVCRSGCKAPVCSGVRQQGVVASHQRDNANKDDKVPPGAPFMPTYCVGSPRSNAEDSGKSKARNGGCCSAGNRMRGGGCGGGDGEARGEEGMYPQSGEVSRAAVARSFDDAWNGGNGCVVNGRLEGGGGGGGVGYEYMERYPVNRSSATAARASRCCAEENPGYPRGQRHTEQAGDSHLDTSHLCASPSVGEPRGSVAAGCCCPGREALARTRQRGNGYARKPCPGVDCLIKTFQEAQEFVESLGRVQGLAGLGLMDPAESPYFGREKMKDSASETMRPVAAASSGLGYLANPQCVGPCNPQMSRLAMGGGGVGGHFQGATPFTIAVPGRGGVVREAVPSMPGPGLRYQPGKSRKRDEKEKLKDADNGSVQPADAESGPCGEPRCRARRRRKSAAEGASLAVTYSADPAKKSAAAAHANMNGGRNSRAANKVKGSSKMRSGRRSSETGPGGDRTARGKSTGKSTRRKMRFVYAAGDTYAGFTCGHRDCLEVRRRVPWNMGWLWNLNETVGKLKPRVGWKPGAIARHVNEMLREARTKSPTDRSRAVSRSSASSRSKSRSAPSRGKRARPHGDRRSVRKSLTRSREDEEQEGPEPPPTLYIRRKDGTYYINMYPIKQDTMDLPKLEVPMKPLQFKIAKNKEDRGSVATSSTASDMEIEFSPPAAVNRYRKKPNVVHVDTQVKQQEIVAAFKTDDGTKESKKTGKKGKK